MNVISIDYFKNIRNILDATVSNMRELRKNPDVFQKIFLVALSAIRAINIYCHTNYLLPLIEVLDQAPAFDFYNWFRIPHSILIPYNSERLDEFDLLNQLEEILCKNWGVELEDERGNLGHNGVKQFVKSELKSFLDYISKEKISFATADEVKGCLLAQMKASQAIHPAAGIRSLEMDLGQLDIVLKPIDPLETAANYALMSADIICVPDFLSGWELLDLGGYARFFGRFPLLNIVVKYPLGDYVWGCLSVGFLLQFINAAKELSQEGLSPSEKLEAQLALAASAAECIFSLSNILRPPFPIINGLALIAKSLGVVACIWKSDSVFFSEDEGV